MEVSLSLWKTRPDIQEQPGNGFARQARNALGIAAVLLGAGCEKTEQKPSPPPPVVEITEVVQRDVPIYREWGGALDGMVNAQILAQVMGYLIKQHYQEGVPVRKGQLLYEIDPRTFQASLDQAKANLARQEAVLKTTKLDAGRVARLLPQNAVSVRDRDNAVGREASAEAEVLAARAAVENAQLEMDGGRQKPAGHAVFFEPDPTSGVFGPV
ncbi:efflux RND transporter periplasmic adaptor subunit [Methylomagnum sp.]